MRLIRIFFLVFLIFSIVGCSSSGLIIATNKSSNSTPVINNILLINQTRDYDLRFRDSISEYFTSAFLQELSNRNIRGDSYTLNDVLSLQQASSSSIASQKGFTYLISVRFYHYQTNEHRNLLQGDVEVRVWKVGSSEAIWVGTLRWRKGCSDHFGSNCTPQIRAQTLSYLIFQALDRDNILPFARERQSYAPEVAPSISAGAVRPPPNAMPNKQPTTAPVGSIVDVATKLQTLKDLFNKGLIGKDDYELKRSELLKQI